MKAIYFWQGRYAGFIVNEWLFAADGRYLGWVDSREQVWKADGYFLGEIVEQHYVLRRSNGVAPVRQTPRVPPVPAEPPSPPAARTNRLPRPGWIDPLEDLLRLPNQEELIGIWQQDHQQVELNADGEFVWTVSPTQNITGRWELRGPLLFLRRWQSEGALEAVPGYRIIEFNGDEVLLRWLAPDQRTLPFWLRRVGRNSDAF